ncbi:site-specific integrase [Subdoligranulum sp. APC924/74]|jgi:integrase|nr:site-specific integrase [Subdoligranulum sp. APC924/74]RCH53144.1 site-specific integrase [Subdoligranulum sp. APC924/74]
MPNNKTTRAASGRGSIRQRPDGRWEARLTLGYDEGTGKRKTLSIYGATQKEVKKKMTEKLRQLDTNTYIADDKRTLAQYLDTWFAEFIVPTQKPYTITTYRGVIKNHLKPNLGAVRLCDLTTEQVQKMVRKLVNAGKAPKTIKNVLTVLNSALEQAVKAQTIQRNPAKFAKIPAVRVKDIHPLSPAEIVAFVDAAQDSPYYAPLMCCLFLGLREGEALGLAWEHVDFENCKVHICQQLQKDKAKGGQFYIQEGTKNGQSRILDVPDFLLEILQEEKQRQLRARLAAGPAWQNVWGLCFTDALGRCINPHTLWANFKRIAASIGLPDARVHDLRHTNATLALVNGDDLKTVQANLGHATAAFTLQRYVHASEAMKRASANRMQQFFDDNVKKA